MVCHMPRKRKFVGVDPRQVRKEVMKIAMDKLKREYPEYFAKLSAIMREARQRAGTLPGLSRAVSEAWNEVKKKYNVA